MSKRVALILAGLMAFGGIIWFIIPDELLHFQIGSVDIEIYKRSAPMWLQVTGLCTTVLLLVIWWKYRKSH
jgi:hypothetical protein